MEIKTLQEGSVIIGHYLLKSSEIKTTSGIPPKDYLDLVLADKSGQINAKLWDASQSDKETFVAPMLVKVEGVVNKYRDQLQVKIQQIRPTTDEDNVTMTDFIRSAPIKSEELIARINQVADSINDTDIKNIVQSILSSSSQHLIHYPAAKAMHHDFYGGLAYHIVRMLEIGEFIVKQRPFLNRDLLLSGIILHDIAKITELDAEIGTVKDYSDAGKLLGHIYIASEWINDVAREFDIDPQTEKIILLKHMILSHHNLGEWGSPVQPQIPEAVALHYIDQIDAKLQAAEDALDMMAQEDGWTTLRILESKQLFKPREMVR